MQRRHWVKSVIGRESIAVGVAPVAVVPRAPSMSPEELYTRHAEAVSRWVANLAGPGAGRDVEDLTHEVFIIAFRRLDAFRGDAKVTTWLYRIALNVVRNQRRRARIRRWFSLSSAQERELSSEALPPDEALERERRRRLVYRVLDRIPERHRAILVMFEIEQLSGAEIAERLEIKLGTVWVRLTRAREVFARELNASRGGA